MSATDDDAAEAVELARLRQLRRRWLVIALVVVIVGIAAAVWFALWLTDLTEPEQDDVLRAQAIPITLNNDKNVLTNDKTIA